MKRVRKFCFPGDNNEPVKEVQGKAYLDLASSLYWSARRRYVNSEFVLGIQTQLGTDVRNSEHVSAMPLYVFFDIIAPSFRLRYADRLQPNLPGILSDLPYLKRVEYEWTRYFAAETDELFEEHPKLAGLILEDCTYEDERGEFAHNSILQMLEDRYEAIHSHVPHSWRGSRPTYVGGSSG